MKKVIKEILLSNKDMIGFAITVSIIFIVVSFALIIVELIFGNV